jgi:hypothetical protein
LRDEAVWALALSGLLGFWLGMACAPNWQVAVETAQVIAGLVTYPAGNPFYIYHLQLWSALTEVLAVLLRLGLSEVTLSEILSGVLGMVSVQALTMCVYALSRDLGLAIGAAFVIFLSRAAEFGGVYPIDLMGTTHTYGILGLSMLVLTAGLFGSGCYRLGGFLLGVAPALHPSMGIWLGLIVAICVATDFGTLGRQLRPALPWFLAGGALTAASLAVHLVRASEVARVPDAVADRYLATFVTFWDGHRRPAPLNNRGVYLNLGILPVALTWLIAYAHDLSSGAGFLLRFVVVSGVLGIAGVFVSWMPADRVPELLQILMPLRVLNIAAMMFVAVLFGLIGVYRRTAAGQAIALVMIAGLLLGDRSQLWALLPDRVLGAFENAGIANAVPLLRVIAIAAAAVTLYPLASGPGAHRAATTGTERHRGLRRSIAAARIGLTAALLLSAVPALMVRGPRALRFPDRTHDPIFATAAAGGGLLLTGNALHLIQLRTRRPVLLDGGALDVLPYSLDAGPAMDRILRDVYGIDLFHPGEADVGAGVIPSGINRHVWEGYSRERWREIRRTYNVTQVMTDQGWRLDLPLIVQSRRLRLYEIPE